jgi:TrmH family RNA methyltransferase
MSTEPPSPIDCWLENLRVVLVRARDPNNIGAVARAMHDFGFRHLRIVSEYAVPYRRARSAIDASAVLAAAQECTTVAEAVADCNLVIGTTAVGLRRQLHPLYTVSEATPLIRETLTSGKVALLFGSEKTGLSNEELSYCNSLLTIPMYRTEGMRHASMNLGQAVAVCLYEIVRETSSTTPNGKECAPAEDLERLTELLIDTMKASEYDRRHPANFDETAIRRLIRQTASDRTVALAWTGILKQILWKLNPKSNR